eukprot:CAMPEP_0196731598 /NCGR_PEP_ID=MMETSP1091-20130531/11259_1 /TAXON_ID=302021 /ORGANISM="Rhodomonas sp., Strain CCMP768" /LENGTH=229 /DNA_ID=CAMNT_0042074743 /DNA_START=212 /DNA_END=896 /DNA_ORIENTATION=-
MTASYMAYASVTWQLEGLSVAPYPRLLDDLELEDRLGADEEEEEGEEQEGAEQYEERRQQVDQVRLDELNPALETLVCDEVQDCAAPVQHEVDEEARGDPEEAAAEHGVGVERAHTETQQPVSVKGRLVDLAVENRLLVGRQHRRPEHAPLVVLDDEAVCGHCEGGDVASAAAEERLHHARRHAPRVEKQHVFALRSTEPEQILRVRRPLALPVLLCPVTDVGYVCFAR